jgi:hypothetical protein
VHDCDNDDIGQFVKVALLRWLTSPSPFGRSHRLGVIDPQRTPRPECQVRLRDVGDSSPCQLASADPRSADDDVRSLDPDLDEWLRQMTHEIGRPPSARETYRALPTNTVFFDRPLRFDGLIRDDSAARAVARQRWFHEAMVAVSDCSIVFLDSDDGVWTSEISGLLERGQSVVTHQLAEHPQRIPQLAAAHTRDIQSAVGVEPFVVAQDSRSSVRLFTVVPSRVHRPDLQDRIGALQMSRWGDEFRVFHRRNHLVTA